MLESFFWRRFFFQGFWFFFQLCITGRGACRHLGGLGRINHVYRIRGQGFGKNVGGGDSKVSIIKLLHGGCSSAAYPPAGQPWPRSLFSFWSLVQICMFKISHLRSLLNGWRIPGLRRCKTAFKAMSVSPVLPPSGVKPAPKGQALRIVVRVGCGWSKS